MSPDFDFILCGILKENNTSVIKHGKTTCPCNMFLTSIGDRFGPTLRIE